MGNSIVRSPCRGLDRAVLLPDSHRLVANLLCCLGGTATAGQVMPSPPDTGFITGINSPVPLSSEVEQAEEWDLGASSLLYYDSNLGLSPDTEEFPADGGLVAILNPEVSWTRKVAGLKASLSVQGGYNQYYDHSQYNGGNYQIQGGMRYEAGRWDLSARFLQGFTEGVNRYYGDSLAQYQYGTGASYEYRISPKTMLDAVWSSSWIDPDDGYASTESHSFNLSAMWRYSPLLRLGPGCRFTNASGELVEERNTLGPTLSADYQLSRKLTVAGRMGLDFVEFSSGGQDQFFSAEMGLNYSPSRLWTVNLSLWRDVVADGVLGGGFREATAVKLGVSRAVRRATVGVNLSYEHDQFTGGSGDVSRAPVDFVMAGVNLDIPVFADSATFTTFVRFQQSVSDDLTRDWDGVQTGCGLSFDF